MKKSSNTITYEYYTNLFSKPPPQIEAMTAMTAMTNNTNEFHIIDTMYLDEQHTETINRYNEIILKYKDIKTKINEKHAAMKNAATPPTNTQQ